MAHAPGGGVMGPVAPMAPMAPMHMMTVMAPVMHMPTSMQMPCGQAQMLAPIPQISQPSAHAVVEQPATNGFTASQPRKVRHNATERRRVQKLKYAYVELDGVLRSRPDLVSIATATSADPSFRKRGREDENGADGLVSSGRRMPVGPAQMPSHLQILQDSAETVRGLFALVDVLSGELDKISQTPEMGSKLIKQTQGLMHSAPIAKATSARMDGSDGNDDDEGTEAGVDDE